jgi:hypothetical protein
VKRKHIRSRPDREQLERSPKCESFGWVDEKRRGVESIPFGGLGSPSSAESISVVGFA